GAATMPTPTDPTTRALSLARDLLAVLPSVPDLPNRDRRRTAVSNLILDLDVLAMLAVPLTAAGRARRDAMIAHDPQKGLRKRKRADRQEREVRAARHAVR